MQRKAAAAPLASKIARRGGEGQALSFSQQRLWLLDQLMGASAVYNISFAIRLQERLDVDILRRCLQTIVARHDALRTRFVARDGDAAIVVDPPSAFAMAVEDAPTPEQVQAIWRAERDYRFDIGAEALFRARLLRESAASHVLVVTMHHIVSDAWSLGVFFKELVSLYRDFSQGRPTSLAELPIQFSDYAAWQRDAMSEAVLAEQTRYWKRQLADLPPLLMLPTDRPRPLEQRFNGAVAAIHIPRDLGEALQQLSKAHGATLFMTLLSAFSVLLGRNAGQSDVVVGAPVANRRRREAEDLIGFFVNTLVMRTDLSGNPGFAELLGRVRDTALQAYAHQDLPFEYLVEALNPERSLAHSPLFQVMFVLQNAPMESVAFEGVKVSTLDGERMDGFSRFDITLSLAEGKDGLKGVFEYNTDLFDHATMARMSDHFIRLLRAVVAAPQRRIADLDFLSEQETRQQGDWNDTAAGYALDSVHEAVAAQAARTPHAPAVVDGDAVIGFAELDRRATALAVLLRRDGVQTGERVGVCMERSIDMVVAMLAVLKAGAAYVAIDPAYPQARIGYIVRHAGITRMLSQEAVHAQLRRAAASVGEVLDILAALDWWHVAALDLAGAADAALLPAGVGGAHAANVVYTSGSTGLPKGVVGCHRSIMNRLQWMAGAWPVAPGEVFAQKTGVSFVDHVAEIFQPLTCGAALAIVPAAAVQSPPDFMRALRRHGVTRLTVVPSLLQALLADSGVGACPSLRLLVTSGETLVLGERAPLRACFPNARLVNLYGSTEIGADVTWHEVGMEEGGAEAAGAVPIGRPIANTRLYVLCPQGRLLPRGAAGELFVAGDGLAGGYLKGAGLTGERFLPDPFSGRPGARMFRTGDLVRYRADGALDYLGRSDQQVKIRGFRIELGEVDAALRACPGVAGAVTVVRRSANGSDHLVAYLVAAAGQARPGTGQLKAHLKAALPHYMVPSGFQFLDAFPLTATGKIDRRALPVREAPGTLHEEPESEYERLLAALWCDLLKCADVGRHQNFFDLGGHSLLVTQLISRIRERFQVELPLVSIFEHQTLEQQARLIAATKAGGAGVHAAIPRLGTAARALPLPLSFSQQRLWFLDKLAGANPSYNIPLALRLSGKLDIAALERSLNLVIERHEALRTRFVDSEGAAAQLVRPHRHVALALELAPDEAALQRAAHEERMHCFDLRGDSLLRVRLLRCGGNGGEHLLLLTIHHIVADGWSLGILFRELVALYRAELAGERAALPELQVQYADFAVWQKAWLEDGVLDRQLDYWRGQLDGLPPVLELPTDRPRPAEQRFHGAGAAFTFSPQLLAGLKEVCRSQGVTLYMVLLAAYALLLRRYSGQEDIAIGTPIANRTSGDAERLIGFFANTLVTRHDLSGAPTFAELLGRTRRMALDAYANQDLPFERLVDALNPERSMRYSPLFQVMFVLQNAPLHVERVEGLAIAPLALPEAEEGISRFDLNLAMGEVGGALSGRMEYNTDLFDRATIERFLGHYERLLQEIVARPDAAIADYALLGEAERQQLLTGWNDGPHTFETNRCLHQLFEAQAARNPQAVALSFEGSETTYGELNRRANQLAHRLRARGVGPDRLVALVIERSTEMVVAILGILKAGGAYVPIDPASPQDRIDYMLDDCGAELVLTAADLAGLEGERDDDPAPAGLTPDHLAYVIYTSGSTGKPKGVLVEHRNVAQLMAATEVDFSFDEHDTWTLFHSFAFDFSVWEIWGALAYGGKLVVVPKAVAQSPLDFYELACREKVTVLNQTPSAFAGFIEADAQLRGTLSLRAVVFGGEKLKPASLLPWTARHGDEAIALVNMYGITETTVHVTYRRLRQADLEGACSLIGPQLAHLTLYILDGTTMQPAPLGVAGELFVGGSGVARGYLNQPELTAQKFVANPFADDPSPRLYRSGDLARRLANGEIEFIGRIDNQVKIRGFRIELGEIEAQLMGHAAVQSAVVLVREDTPGDKRLAAYLVFDPSAEAPFDAAGALRAHLAATLPDYMLPGAYVVLESLPLTNNGKLDTRRLPRPDTEAYARRQYAAPTNALEAKLAQLWQQNLGVAQVGIDDNYFAVGGDSIRSIALAAQAKAMGIPFMVRDLFVNPTIAGLARAMAAGDVAVEAPDTDMATETEAFDLISDEERQALLDQFS
nr:non-ribosomal peptide synthetase [Massilia sp. CFBP 13721]